MKRYITHTELCLKILPNIKRNRIKRRVKLEERVKV
jgi:hypothetical protein